MNWRLVFTLFLLFSTQTFSGEVLTPYCEKCSHPVIEHKEDDEGFSGILQKIAGEPFKRIPDDYTETHKGCPFFSKTLRMSEKLENGKELEIFNVELKRGTYTQEVSQPKIKDGKGHYVDRPPLIVEKDKCCISFKKDCGSDLNSADGVGKISAIEKLDWLKANLREVDPVICEKVVDDFANQCGPWAGLSRDERKAEALRLTQLAVESYIPGPTAAPLIVKIPSHEANKKPLVTTTPLTKSPYLKTHLMQCLMHRENHDYEPNKLNYTECGVPSSKDPYRQIKATSTANGLYQILESTANDLIKRNVLGNYCWQFSKYWQKVLPEKKTTQFTNADIYPKPKTCANKLNDDLVKNMSDYPEFQAAIGVALVNYFLEMTAHDVDAHGKPHYVGEDITVKRALDRYWFTTGNSEDSSSVMSCQKCLDGGGANCL